MKWDSFQYSHNSISTEMKINYGINVHITYYNITKKTADPVHWAKIHAMVFVRINEGF